MPEYLAPGVYIEEVSFRQKTIEGVSTSTAGFVAPARFGPTSGDPELLTSFADLERIYGSLDQLTFTADSGPVVMDNHLAHATRSFFEEGGKRLYVSRVFKPLREPPQQNQINGQWDDGQARVNIETADSIPETIALRARYPGSGGNVTVTFTARISPNTLAGEPEDPANPGGAQKPVLRGVRPYDLVWITDQSSPIESPPGSGTLYWAERYFDETTKQTTWRFRHDEDAYLLELEDLTPGQDEVRLVTVNVQVTHPGRFPRTQVWEDLTFHPKHRNSLSAVFGEELSRRSEELTVPIVFETALTSGPAIASVILGQERPQRERRRLLRLLGLSGLTEAEQDAVDLSILATLGEDKLSDSDRQITFNLTGGNDGKRPDAGDYEGRGDDDPTNKSGLKVFEDIANISIVAAPGYSAGYNNGYKADADQIMRLLISHCERMRYRIAVLDAPEKQSILDVRTYRSQVDSSHAALYYPWIRILDPVTDKEIHLPPSGFVAGIYARNDIDHGVHKAPANEVVRQAIGLEVLLNKAQQDVLNPNGINCFRFFEGRGFRLWGARTISSDPELKYVNLRRYLAYLEHSIERGTQWAVFENNGDRLWANITLTIDGFLFNEWKSGHLMGRKPEEAYFVRCDRSTMTQNDIDNGRLICLIGVALLRPAEFVIFRIGQWTADSRR